MAQYNADKINYDTGDQGKLNDTEFNSYGADHNNLVTSAGLTPNNGDLLQYAKSLGQYVADGNFYDEDGASTADAIVVIPHGARQGISNLVNGVTIRFIPANTNTTATPTIKVNNLTVKTIKNATGGALNAGDIASGQLIELLYDGTNFRLQTSKLSIGSGNYIRGTGAGIEEITPQEVANEISPLGYSQDLSISGYTTLPNGLIMQWGRQTNITSNQYRSITFPIAFPVACASFTALQATDNGNENQINSVARTNTNIQIHNSTGTTISVDWIAIGY